MTSKLKLVALSVLLATLIGGPGSALADECGETLLAKGENLHSKALLEAVIEVYTQAFETCDMSDELTAHIYTRRGIVFFSMSEYRLASEDYTSAFALMKDRPNLILMKRAVAYMAIDEHDLAVTDLDEAIAKDPGKSAIYLMRMNANRQRGDFDAVATDFETVKALGDPSALMQAERIMKKIVPAS